MKPLDRVAGMSVLKNCGVRKVFKYSRSEPPPPHAATAPSRLVDICIKIILLRFITIRQKVNGLMHVKQDEFVHLGRKGNLNFDRFYKEPNFSGVKKFQNA